jgi:hypothetical protein
LSNGSESRLAGAHADGPNAVDSTRLLHESEVHEIKLELQNAELRQAQVELEKTRDRLWVLDDFAPSGHLNLVCEGETSRGEPNGCGAAGDGQEPLVWRQSRRLHKPIGRRDHRSPPRRRASLDLTGADRLVGRGGYFPMTRSCQLVGQVLAAPTRITDPVTGGIRACERFCGEELAE